MYKKETLSLKSLVNLLALQSSLGIQKFRKYIELITQRLEVADGLVDSLETLVFDLLKKFSKFIRFILPVQFITETQKNTTKKVI